MISIHIYIKQCFWQHIPCADLMSLHQNLLRDFIYLHPIKKENIALSCDNGVEHRNCFDPMNQKSKHLAHQKSDHNFKHYLYYQMQNSNESCRITFDKNP